MYFIALNWSDYVFLDVTFDVRMIH